MMLTVSAVSSTLFAADATVYVGFQYPSRSITTVFYIGKATGTVVGARVSTGGRIAFEQSIGYSPNLMSYLIDVFNTQSNLVVRFPVGKVTPYATAGVGLMKAWGDSGRASLFGTRFTVNYGGGIKFNRVVGPLGVRVDVRGYTAPSFPIRSRFGEVLGEENLNFIEGTIGAVYSW
jgi:hypothetical protein